MRWATFRESDSGPDRVGLVDADTILAMPDGIRLIDLLGDDGARLAEAAAQVRRAPAGRFPVAQVHLRPPIPQPPSIRDFSAFEEHCRNGLKALGRDVSADWYEIPVFYFANPNSVLGQGDPVTAPGNTLRLDYELEIGIMIGKEGINLTPDEAEAHIAGYCVMNDWSARDLQNREMQLVPIGPAKGKDFANGFGPWLVTPDELADKHRGTAYDLTMTASVNGKRYSAGNFSDIYWTPGQLLAYASRGARLVPGDIIGTGTCGSGCILELSALHGEDTYPWLRPGDEVTLDIECLGTLTNRVVAGAEPHPLK